MDGRRNDETGNPLCRILRTNGCLDSRDDQRYLGWRRMTGRWIKKVILQNVRSNKRILQRIEPVVSDLQSDTTLRQEARLLINIYNWKAILDEMNL